MANDFRFLSRDLNLKDLLATVGLFGPYDLVFSLLELRPIRLSLGLSDRFSFGIFLSVLSTKMAKSG